MTPEEEAFSSAYLTGFTARIGYEFVEFCEDHVTLLLPVADHHLNRMGTVHGGVIMTLLDAACGFSCSNGRTAPGATIQLSVSFMAAPSTGPLRAVGKKVGGGRSIYMATGEVFDGNGVLCAVGQGSFKSRSLERRASE